MIFVDVSVALHIAGSPHPYKDRAEALIEQLRASGEELVTDTDVYRDVLHRYASALASREAHVPFGKLDSIVDKVFTFGMAEINSARELLCSVDGISAQQAIHIAVMRREGITRILSFSVYLDACPGIERIY